MKKIFSAFLLVAMMLIANVSIHAQNNLIRNTEEKDGVIVTETVYKLEGGTLVNYMKHHYKYDDVLLNEIWDIVKENLYYFCISHIEDESLSIEQEKLVELMEVCKKHFDVKSVEVNEKLYELGKYAYDNELISFSKLQYYLNYAFDEYW